MVYKYLRVILLNKSRLLGALCASVFTLLTNTANATGFAPVVVGGIIDQNPITGNPDSVVAGPLNVTNAPPISIQQGIIEFNLSSVSLPTSQANLNLDVTGVTTTGAPQPLDVYGYIGDGVLDLNDWSAGVLIVSTSTTGFGPISIDITSFINGLPEGTSFIGFNLRAPVDGFVTNFDPVAVTIGFNPPPKVIFSYRGVCNSPTECPVAGLNRYDPVSASFSFDSSILTGSSNQWVWGDSLTSLNVSFGTETFSTADIVPGSGGGMGAALVINGSVSPPVLTGSAGANAIKPNGDFVVFFTNNVIPKISGIQLHSSGTWNVTYEFGSDQDNDGVSDTIDNCPVEKNPSQSDVDGDGAGDLCDICPTDDTDICVKLLFEGTISSMQGNITSALSIGDSFSATLMYDAGFATGTDYGVEQVYEFPATPVAYTLDVEMGPFSASGTDGIINILNDFSSGQDWFKTSSGLINGFSGDLIAGSTWKQATIVLKDYDGVIFSDTSLPSAIPLLSEYEEAFGTMFFSDGSLAQAQITSITVLSGPDSDSDGIGDTLDNCPIEKNPSQSDIDGDGTGDLCDICPADNTDTCNTDGSSAGEISAADGGTVSTPDGQLAIDVDPGDLTGDTTISVTETTFSDPEVNLSIGATAGAGQALTFYDLEPDGTLFANPVTLSIMADVTSLNQKQREKLDIYRLEDNDLDGTPETFVSLGAICTVLEDPIGTFIATCTVQVNHFSTYAVVVPLDTDGDGVPDNFDGIADACPNEDATGFDVDSNGCIDSFTGLVELVAKLVNENVITTTMQNSLLSKVSNAEKSAGKENVCAAINELEAFKNQVDAQIGKKISAEAATQVKDYADSVALYLLSQLPSGETCNT